MDVTLPVRRETPRLAVWLAAGALLVLAGLAPLGLPRLAGALGLATVLTPGANLGSDVQINFLAVVLGRLALQIPVGDLPMRLAVLSGVFSAAALGFLARAGLEVAGALRPPAHARVTAADVAHEPVGVLGAALVVGISQPVFIHATLAALDGVALLLLAVWIWLSTRVMRDRLDARAALGASFVAGVALATTPLLGCMIVPCGVALWLWGLRHRAAWVRLAPALFVVGAALLLPAAILDAGQAASLAGWWHVLSLGALRAAMTSVTAAAWLQAALQLAEALSVVAGLLILIGCGVLAWRAPAVAAVVLFVLWAAVMLSAAGPSRELPLALWLCVAVIPLSVGILHFAAKLGRARVPAAWTLVVMAAVGPLLVGGLSRWLPDGRLPLHMLIRAQDNLSPRSVVNPGSREMQLMFQYGAAVGLRPDLSAKPAGESVD